VFKVQGLKSGDPALEQNAEQDVEGVRTRSMRTFLKVVKRARKITSRKYVRDAVGNELRRLIAIR
jgi:hypothetical protein